MTDFQDKVIAGNVVLYPKVLREFLTKSRYFLRYEPEEEELILMADHDQASRVLFVMRNVSYETAVKIAVDLGLTAKENRYNTPTIWTKWNPILRLCHDGSEDAEILRLEMLKLGIPHIVRRNEEVLCLINDRGAHRSPAWTAEKMLEIARETAETYKEQLSTTP